jgi:hypothetical protein
MSLLKAHSSKFRLLDAALHVKWQPVVTPTVSLTSSLLAFRNQVHIYDTLPYKNEASEMRASHLRERNQAGRKRPKTGHNNDAQSQQRVKESLLTLISLTPKS